MGDEPMTAVYFVTVANVADWERLREYEAEAVGAVVSATPIGFDESVTTLEGDERGRAVILKFESKEAALEWYHSEAYQKVLPLRLDATSEGWAGIVTAIDGAP
jgi:uncharacterized protein (DUF1330 family)